MALNSTTLAAIAAEIARSPLEAANLDEHVATLSALVEGVERLRRLPLKDYEPRLVFVPVEDVDPMYFVRAYYLVPTQGGAKAYRLLAKVMEDSGKAGIARFVMRAKEYLVALIAENGILRAETLRFANELRTAEDVGLPEPTKVSAADERKVAAKMKKLYKATFSPKE